MKNLMPWKKKSEELTPAGREEHPFELLHRRMNDLFEDFFKDFGSEGRWPSLERFGLDTGAEVPRFEVSETDDEVRVKAELPGMDEKDIEVTLDENILTIRGEKKEEKEDKKRNVYVSECRYGSFHRSMALPAGIDRDKAKAKFKKGVLTLTLPKTETAGEQRKQIEITSE